MTERIEQHSGVTPYRRCEAGTQPASLCEPYRSSVRRAPSQPLIYLPHTLSEVTGPIYGHGEIGETDNDLTVLFDGAKAEYEPLSVDELIEAMKANRLVMLVDQEAGKTFHKFVRHS